MWFLSWLQLPGPHLVQLVRKCEVCRLQIQTKIDIIPFDPFPRTLLLPEHKHMVIEKLLELLVHVIDEVLVSTRLKNLKASYIEDTNEGGFGRGTV
jgi:hypothetical protein